MMRPLFGRRSPIAAPLFIIAALLALVLSACGVRGETGQTVRVGSKDFTEQFILGHMYALALEEAGFRVERRLNLGGTPVAQAALEAGEIDLYPEYTGTALLTVLGRDPLSDPQQVYDIVSQEYQERYNLVWLEPAQFNNTQALAMTRDRSAELGITTISDMVAVADQLVMAGPPEFEGREDGLPGLRQAYGDFTLRAYKAIDPGLRYQALLDGEADVVVAFGTDGEIAAFDLVLLEDDRGFFPPYQVAPVVRREALDANPGIADALNALAPLLTDDVMRQLNFEVSNSQREPEDVAREFLVQEGIIEE